MKKSDANVTQFAVSDAIPTQFWRRQFWRNSTRDPHAIPRDIRVTRGGDLDEQTQVDEEQNEG